MSRHWSERHWRRAKLRQLDVAVAQGAPLAEAIRGIGVSEVTYLP